jgi:hypothetical protein
MRPWDRARGTSGRRRPVHRQALPRRGAAPCFAGLAALWLGACSGSDATETTLGDGRHALSTTVFQADGQTSLVGLVDDPAAPGVFDVTTALEVGGSAALFGDDGRNVFSLGSSDSATVTRYELSPTGQLSERGSLSLQPYGITSAFKRPELVPMISATKAYWVDDGSAQVVVWNPEAMTLTGTISLAAAQREGWVLEVGQAVARDGLLFISANYRDDADGEAGEAVAIVIDTLTDAVVEVATDVRCGGTLDIARGPAGELYFASNTLAASFYALGRFEGYPGPCVLRIAPGEQTFDPGYYVSMLELTGGRAAGQLVLGASGRAFLLALHTDLLAEPLGPDSELFAPYEAAAWRWWSVELGSLEGGSVGLGSLEPGGLEPGSLEPGGLEPGGGEPGSSVAPAALVDDVPARSASSRCSRQVASSTSRTSIRTREPRR